MAPKQEQAAIAWLTSVIDAAETDPWQEQARAAVAARDWAGLERMLTGEQAANTIGRAIAAAGGACAGRGEGSKNQLAAAHSNRPSG